MVPLNCNCTFRFIAAENCSCDRWIFTIIDFILWLFVIFISYANNGKEQKFVTNNNAPKCNYSFTKRSFAFERLGTSRRHAQNHLENETTSQILYSWGFPVLSLVIVTRLWQRFTIEICKVSKADLDFIPILTIYSTDKHAAKQNKSASPSVYTSGVPARANPVPSDAHMSIFDGLSSGDDYCICVCRGERQMDGCLMRDETRLWSSCRRKRLPFSKCLTEVDIKFNNFERSYVRPVYLGL